jgi:hypothetical protein
MSIAGENVTFIMKFVQSSIALIQSPGDPKNEPYKISRLGHIIHTTDINITDSRTNELVASMENKFAINPFDLDYDIKIRNDTSGNLENGELDFDVFYIWNKFDIELKQDHNKVKYKTMCGLSTRTCNIIVARPKQPPMVLALIDSGKAVGEYSVTISRDLSVGIGLLSAYAMCYQWNQENVRLPAA